MNQRSERFRADADKLAGCQIVGRDLASFFVPILSFKAF
jgi:hypothetical protein